MRTQKQRIVCLGIILVSILSAYFLKSTFIAVVSGFGLFTLLLNWVFNLPAAPLVSVFLGFTTLELGLRVLTDNYRTYTERIGTGYVSMYKNWIDDYYFKHPPNWEYHRQQKEFSFLYETNSLGIFAQEPAEVDTNKYVILCLGDSFTEGVGAPQDSSWPASLQRKLDFSFPDSFEVVNAGIGGSDLFFEWKLYEDLLDTAYSPNEVIVFLGDSDLEDVLMRLGDDRFRPDGSVQFRAAPWWEPLFMFSYSARVVVLDFLGYGFHLMKPDERNQGFQQSCFLIEEKIDAISKMMERKNTKLTIYAHPQPNELENGYFDTPCFIGLVTNSDLPVVNFIEEMQLNRLVLPSNYNDLYWPIDGHYTAEGYDFLAQVIATRYINSAKQAERLK